MKIIQITGTSDGPGKEYLYGIDEQGRVYRYNFTMHKWDAA